MLVLALLLVAVFLAGAFFVAVFVAVFLAGAFLVVAVLVAVAFGLAAVFFAAGLAVDALGPASFTGPEVPVHDSEVSDAFGSNDNIKRNQHWQ